LFKDFLPPVVFTNNRYLFFLTEVKVRAEHTTPQADVANDADLKGSCIGGVAVDGGLSDVVLDTHKAEKNT